MRTFETLRLVTADDPADLRDVPSKLAPRDELPKGIRHAELRFVLVDRLDQSFVLLPHVRVDRTGFIPSGRMHELIDRERFLRLEVFAEEKERPSLRPRPIVHPPRRASWSFRHYSLPAFALATKDSSVRISTLSA